jgi:uncharacterized protein (TIGR00730 family)
MKKVKKIALFGYADLTESDSVYKEAYETAKILAQAGYTIVDGGGPGVMKAASLGAKAGGGKTVGVTFYPRNIKGKPHPGHFEGRDKSNPLDREIITRNYVERTLKLLEIADVYVIFKGGTGTISEFAMAWALARLYFGHHRPFLLYGSFWHEIMEALASNMLIRSEELKVYEIVDSPQEVLEEIRELERGN